MTKILIALVGAALLFAVSAEAQTVNTRIAPQGGNINVDGSRKMNDQQKKMPSNAAQAMPAKKTGDNKGIGAPPIALQRPN